MIRVKSKQGSRKLTEAFKGFKRRSRRNEIKRGSLLLLSLTAGSFIDFFALLVESSSLH